MTFARHDPPDGFKTVPNLPSWIPSGQAETVEDAAFLSGAVLSHVHLVLGENAASQDLLRERLGLRAAVACLVDRGRPERAGALRDALAFLQPGDGAGPAGELYLSWKKAVARPVGIKTLSGALPTVEAEQIAIWLDGGGASGQAGPVARAARVMQSVLEDRPRDRASALILAEASLATMLGWSHVMPLFTLGLKRGDLTKRDADLRLACHRAIVSGATDAIRELAQITRRAARLREVAPKLRAKGSDEAVALFLTRDAVAPTHLTSLRSDRAARRFCDRLVELDVVRELTGRDTFRLYGL